MIRPSPASSSWSATVLGAMVLGGLFLGIPAGAEAYVRTHTSRGNPIAWQETCVFMVPPAEVPAGLSQPAVLGAIGAAAQVWTDVPGSYMRFVVEPAAAGGVREYNPGGQNENMVFFVESGWEYPRDALAITTITYIASSRPSEDGRILDADIEINAQYASLSTGGEVGRHDLQAVLAHELGHVLGLDHTCDDGEVVPTPVDHLGNTIPLCNPLEDLPPEIVSPTMFNYIDRGELDKRTLDPDDVAGLTAIYPLARDPKRCAPPEAFDTEQCGCGQGGGPRHALPFVLVVLWLIWRFRWRSATH